MIKEFTKSALIEISLSGTLLNFKRVGDYLVSIGNDPNLSIWNTDTLELVYKKEGNDHPVADAIITDDYHIIASNDGTIHIYHMDNPKQEIKLPEIPLSLLLNQQNLFIGTTSNKLFIYDLTNLQFKIIETDSWITQLGQKDNNICLFGNEITQYNLNELVQQEQKQIQSHKINFGHKGLIMNHQFYNDYLITGDSSGQSILSKNGNIIFKYQMPSAIVQQQICEEFILIGTFDPGIHVVDFQGKLLKIIENRAGPLLYHNNKLFSRSDKLTRLAYFYKFGITANIERLILSVAFSCKIQIQWKRGKQKLETNLYELQAGQSLINQSLTLETNMYFEDNKFLDKKSAFVVLLIVPGKASKVAGQSSIDIASYLNKQQESAKEVLRLDKCPDKHAKIQLTLNFKLLGEIDIDTLSRMSRMNDSFESQMDENVPEQQEQKQQKKILEDNHANDDEISVLNKEINDTRQQLQKTLMQVQQRDQQISQLQQEIQQKTEMLNEQLNEANQSKNKLYETLDQLQETQEQLEKSQTQLEQIKQSFQQVIQQDKNKKQIIQDLEDKNFDLKNELHNKEIQNSQLQLHIQQLAQCVQDKENEQNTNTSINKTQQQQLSEALNSKINQLQEQYNKLKNQYEQEQCMFNIKEKNFQHQLENKDEQIKQIQQKQQQPSSQTLEIKKMMEEHKNITQQLQKQNQELQQQISLLTQQIKNEKVKQDQEIQLYQMKEKNLQNQLIDKQSEIAKLMKNQTNTSSNSSQNYIQEIGFLKQEIQKFQQKDEAHNKTIEQYKDSLQKQILTEKKLKQQYDSKIRQMEDEIINMKIQIGNMFNVAAEFRDPKLLDRLQIAYGLQG